MKRFLSFITSKKVILAFVFLLNIAMFLGLVLFVDFYVYSAISFVVEIAVLFFLLSSDDAPIYKTMWAIVILILPLFGVILYLYLRNCKASKKNRCRFNEIRIESKKLITQNKSVLKDLANLNNGQINLANYILSTTGMPVSTSTDLKYLHNGEEYFKNLIEDLKNAESFVLMQYYIIAKGKLWDAILDILKEKVKNGVEVKILYDDFGCMDKMSPKEFKEIRSFGIDAVAFNRCRPTINKYSQYRDHRKLCVIDGKIGYVGGINLADEYVNLTNVYGYWKDTGVRLEGDAVWNLTVLFSHNWQQENNKFDLNKYKIEYKTNNNSFVQAFGSSPLYREPIARNNYVNMINSAKQYVYITTPYLLLDTTTIDALKIAAKSGVDVKIVMPGVPDKKFVWYMGRSHYKELVEAGIKIYEYKPGFIHAKMVVVDDISACIGTINFDFRSLYLHFENAIMIYNDKSIVDIKQDIVNVIDESMKITKEVVKNRKWSEKLIANLLQFFAPLM